MTLNNKGDYTEETVFSAEEISASDDEEEVFDMDDYMEEVTKEDKLAQLEESKKLAAMLVKDLARERQETTITRIDDESD